MKRAIRSVGLKRRVSSKYLEAHTCGRVIRAGRVHQGDGGLLRKKPPDIMENREAFLLLSSVRLKSSLLLLNNSSLGFLGRVFVGHTAFDDFSDQVLRHEFVTAELHREAAFALSH